MKHAKEKSHKFPTKGPFSFVLFGIRFRGPKMVRNFWFRPIDIFFGTVDYWDANSSYLHGVEAILVT